VDILLVEASSSVLPFKFCQIMQHVTGVINP